jgi:hypothetical protein
MMMDDDVRAAIGGILGSETKVLKGNLLQCHFVHQKFHMT